MKRIAAMLRSCRHIVAGLALFALVGAGAASASVIIKTFEFGPGTQYSKSNVRTFSVPCGRQVAAVVKFKRLGPAAASSDIPITIEFREPDTAPDQEGPLVETKSVQAKTTEQSVTMFSSGGGSSRGCELPWRIRVKHAGDGSPAYAVSGTGKISYDGQLVSFRVDSPSILKGASQTVKFGDATGLKQGTIKIVPDWQHEIVGIAAGGGENIAMKFELIDPGGAVFQTYTSVHQRSLIKIFVEKCTPGQWKWKITNLNNNDDATGPKLHTDVTPECF